MSKNLPDSDGSIIKKSIGARAIVLHPVFRENSGGRSPEACLEEAMGLALAIDLDIAQGLLVSTPNPKPGTLFGSGKIEEVQAIIDAEDVKLAVVDTQLTPVQQRNLEKTWNVKVIDRTALILEIFGARARTNEGKLQVELAALNYQKGRLVRSWTHLERQRGGSGSMSGPGESQIETDRRIIRNEITKIQSNLEKVVRTRSLHRKKRHDAPYPLVALVGYTNAGKSTLFNRLTSAETLAEDALFATLDPTIRSLILPNGMQIMMSDTVGFISNLPTQLVAAFRATLEEVLDADLILHVRDASHPDNLAQKNDVETVLRALFKTEELPTIIEVMNKIDLLAPEQRAEYAPAFNSKNNVSISAITGAGIEELQQAIVEKLNEQLRQPFYYKLDCNDGKALAWLYAHGDVKALEEIEGFYRINALLSAADNARFCKLFLKELPVEE